MRVKKNHLLAPHTWFQVGGMADVFAQPRDIKSLCDFLEAYPHDPVMMLGAGSNLLIRDGGIRGCVLQLRGDFTRIDVEGDDILAGCGALDRTISQVALSHGLGGLSFLIGIPGTLGGAIRMNAGAYGSEIKDILVKVWAVDRQGKEHILDTQDLQFGYRTSVWPEGWIAVRAQLRGHRHQTQAQIQEEQTLYLNQRAATQPVKGRTGGSTFRNPSDLDLRAWQMIDRAGCRGWREGGAQISEKHCNFMMNTGGATAHDLECLGERVRQHVRDALGYDLQWEIVRVGEEKS